MRLEVFRLDSNGDRVPVLELSAFNPTQKNNPSVVMDAAVETTLKKIAAEYFQNGFGLSRKRLESIGPGVLRQILNCSGRHVRMEVKNGVLQPVEDKSAPDRTFEIIVRFTDDEIRGLSMSKPRIIYAYVRNFRGVDRVEFGDPEASRRCSALVEALAIGGYNGSGKTSLLYAMLLAFGRDEIAANKQDQDFQIRIAILDENNKRFFIERTPATHTIRNDDGEIIASSTVDVKRMMSNVGISFYSSWRTPVLIGGIPAGVRRVPRAVKDGALPRLKGILVDKFLEERTESMLLPGEGIERILARISAYWNRFNQRNAVAFQIQKIERRIFSRSSMMDERLKFDVLFEKGGRVISVDDLSSGEIELFCFIGAMVIDGPGLDILLIDEPELHMNPSWHSMFLPCLREIAPSVQLIIATHSSNIWNTVYRDQRVYLENGCVGR